MRVWARIVLLLIAPGLTGCGSSTPTAPTSTTPVTSTVGTASLTSLSPNMGSTGGATEVLIKGAGLGATVTFGGVAVQGRFDSRYPNAVMLVYTPPHAAGSVDIVLSSMSGGPITLPNGFTYAAPEAFDFNGSWSGFGNNGQDMPILFTIRNNLLISAECQGWPGLLGRAITFSPPVPLTNSEFSYAGEDGAVFSGRIVAPNMSSGVIRLGPCTSDAWYASRQ